MISPIKTAKPSLFTVDIDLIFFFFIRLEKETLTKAIWRSARSPTKFQTSHSVTASELISFIALKYQSGTFEEFWVRG